jgi:hypothetical protein
VVLLYNNTRVDLVVWTELNKSSLEIAPGSAAEVTLHSAQWIDFGMVAHRYEVPSLRHQGFVYGHEMNRVKIQAENDGRLYLVRPDAAFPMEPLPKQPSRFPLLPIEEVDQRAI